MPINTANAFSYPMGNKNAEIVNLLTRLEAKLDIFARALTRFEDKLDALSVKEEAAPTKPAKKAA